MKITKHGLFAMLLLLLPLVDAQDQSGVISLDCGLPSKVDSYESDIGITYISDQPFVTSGVNKIISPENQSDYPIRFSRLRAFPEGTRNCYTINVTRDTTYSIRASFYYGNYDNKNFPPEFSLHLGPNFWDTIYNSEDIPFGRNIIHLTKQDYVQVCLVNNGTGVPFISVLELRPLTNDVYESVSGSLVLNDRFDLGSTTNVRYRYPYDSFDRTWDYRDPDNDISNWTTISTTLSVNSGLNYKVPTEVMRTAITPLRVNDPLVYRWSPFYSVENSSFYVYFHFAEIQKLKPNESRVFDIYANGELIYGPVIPDYLRVTTVYSPSPLKKLNSSSSYYNITLVKRENSTLPPILNAIELYMSQDSLLLDTNEDDVKTLRIIKSVYGVKRNWDGDPCGPKVYAWRGLTCSDDGHDRPRVNSLNLSSSGLTGEITLHISKLAMLQSLDLSNNNLVGSVPNFLSELPNLRVLKLENNKFTGAIPAQLIEKTKNGSLILSVGRTEECTTSSQCKRKKNNIIIPIGASIGGFVLLLSAATATLFIMKRNTTRTPEIKSDLFESKKRQFTYSEVLTITNNFERILGKGGFGAVYHGIIDSTQVAVKMLSPTSHQGYQQFEAEVKLLMTVHHRNLTRLIGYCNEGTNMTLIYEYMANGDLESHLSDEIRGKALNWERRLEIALDTAQGLEYLHNGCRPAIVHRDIKNANILLTENFQAKLADFGLSKSFPTDGGTHVSTVVAGTPGYLDPEYSTTNRLTEKSDVYSFGVVLLQIITSRAAILRVGSERIHISDWVYAMLGNGDIMSIIDQRLEHEEFEANSVWKAVEIAMSCVSVKSTNRPNMSQVVVELKECLMAMLPQRNNHNTTNFTNSAQVFSFADSTCDFPPSPR